MRILSATIIMAVILVSSAFCQVDTLILVEINSIEVSGEITHLYTESIRDDIQEIFICTQDHIYVYDSQTNELIWSRGELINPEDLLFEDINNDGFKDLAFRDSLNIFLYDVINSDHIWTSPQLDSTYCCYTIGDRNDDGWIDVVVLNHISENNSSDYDTARVDIFNGPAFSLVDSLFLLLTNYIHDDGYFTDHAWEYPINICIAKIDGDGGLYTKTIVFSCLQGVAQGHSYYHYYLTGSLFIIDSDNGEYFIINDIGKLLYKKFIEISAEISLYTLCIFGDVYLESASHEIDLQTFSADILISSDQIFYSYSDPYYPQGSLWRGFIVDDLSAENPGDEICVGIDDYIYIASFPSLNTLSYVHNIPGTFQVLFSLKCQYIYTDVQIICKFTEPYIEYHFFGVNDLVLTSILPQQNFELSQITDLDGDGNDELLSIQDNELHIYHLDYYVDIDQPETLPYHTFIQPNYPNPFNSSTAIEYGLKQDAHVTLEIYDLLGRKVETLVDVYQPAGMHRAIWNAARISTGIYFYKINAGDFSKTRKMLLLK